MEYRIDIEPNTKPRQTRSDKWNERPCVMRYRAFADELRYKVAASGYRVGKVLDIQFIITMPNSWSVKKKAAYNGLPHETTPDIDNLLKAFMDALMAQDKKVHTVTASKIWGIAGSIILR